jgi:hypothetical protein
MSRESIAIKVNDNIDHYFQTRKRVRQGDPLYPIMFNIVLDILVVLISWSKDVGGLRGCLTFGG